MEGEHGALDGKGQRHGQKGPELQFRAEGLGHQFRDGECSARDVEGDDGHQKQGGTGQRVEEELDGCVALVRSAPDRDEQVHGHEHGFPEEVEEHEVQGREDADAGRGHEQQDDVELLDAPGDVVPGAEHAQRQEGHGQQDHEQADAVDAEMVGQPPLRHPGCLLHELEPA